MSTRSNIAIELPDRQRQLLIQKSKSYICTLGRLPLRSWEVPGGQL